MVRRGRLQPALPRSALHSPDGLLCTDRRVVDAADVFCAISIFLARPRSLPLWSRTWSRCCVRFPARPPRRNHAPTASFADYSFRHRPNEFASEDLTTRRHSPSPAERQRPAPEPVVQAVQTRRNTSGSPVAGTAAGRSPMTAMSSPSAACSPAALGHGPVVAYGPEHASRLLLRCAPVDVHSHSHRRGAGAQLFNGSHCTPKQVSWSFKRVLGPSTGLYRSRVPLESQR